MKKKSNEQLIFPIIVGVLSFINILRNIQEFYLSSVLISLVGLAAVVLFYLDNKKATSLFYVWILAQVVTYQTTSFTYFTNQLPQFSLGLDFNGNDSVFAINFAPLFFLIGYRVLKMYDLVGKMVSILPIKANSALDKLEGEIVEVISIQSSGKWFKVQYFKEGNPEPQFVMIKPKGQEQFSLKNSVVAFVNEPGEVTKFIDWGAVKLR